MPIIKQTELEQEGFPARIFMKGHEQTLVQNLCDVAFLVAI
jgi:hypothetical protein